MCRRCRPCRLESCEWEAVSGLAVWMMVPVSGGEVELVYDLLLGMLGLLGREEGSIPRPGVL